MHLYLLLRSPPLLQGWYRLKVRSTVPTEVQIRMTILDPLPPRSKAGPSSSGQQEQPSQENRTLA